MLSSLNTVCSSLRTIMNLLLAALIFGMAKGSLIIPGIPASTTTCQGDLTISCPAGTVITVLAANFGRKSSTDCPNYTPIISTNCISTSTLPIVETQCNGKTSCSIPATTAVFGDPCPGNTKYLQVTYVCTKIREQRVAICQGTSQTISCSAGQTLDITYANFGRTDATTCPDPRILTTVCQSDVLSTVQTSCQGKQSCTLSGDGPPFKDPCANTFKYLDVQYRCVSTTTICQNNLGTIRCPLGQVLVITSGTYGRQDTTNCLNPFGSATNTNCFSANGFNVASSCNTLPTCTLLASNFVYGGDPCPGTSKYAQISWYCRNI